MWGSFTVQRCAIRRACSKATGKFMRHVKLRPGTATNAAELSRLIEAAYADIKARVEHG